MNTPIDDFVKKYAEGGEPCGALRLHMPGHKGVGDIERFDITEISGADSLYEADGIIAESERNAAALFGAHTFYSAEGSSLCIRAMLYLVALYAAEKGQKPRMAAGRNAHKTFVSALCLLDMDVDWLMPGGASYLSCPLTPEYIEQYLRSASPLPTAVYLTSPDYLGNTVDIAGICAVCHRYGVLLLVDNAHGAYLKFLPESRHPIDLGADMCCDSAHKTLPALTGAAYLHISPQACDGFRSLALARVRDALALFGSTSPSYLILASLDRTNLYISQGYLASLAEFVGQVDELKKTLSDRCFGMVGDEPLKLTLAPKSYGYTGDELAALLRREGIEPEFCDPDHLVLMLTPSLGDGALPRLLEALCSVPRREPVALTPPAAPRLPERVMSVREAMMAPAEVIDADACVGRVLAAVTVGCPPAVPIVVSGERMDENVRAAFRYYGIKKCTAVK
ncbi:MAG: PLP-dependent transferase [Clostridia bacterium]|nr:PLP-dependent transferase [Clostridia bacterium]